MVTTGSVFLIICDALIFVGCFWLTGFLFTGFGAFSGDNDLHIGVSDILWCFDLGRVIFGSPVLSFGFRHILWEC